MKIYAISKTKINKAQVLKDFWFENLCLKLKFVTITAIIQTVKYEM